MPETPDFEQLARTIICGVDAESIQNVIADHHSPSAIAVVARVEAQLRFLWNARGALDIATIEHDLSTMMGATASGPYLKNLDRALRALDR